MRIALIGGMWWPVTETNAGLPTFQARLRANGAEVQTYSHSARQQIRDWLYGYKGFRALCGDSLGAGASALYAGDLTDGLVQFAGGFQPSDWDPIAQGPLNNKEVVVSKNVVIAHCIWDPVFIDTVGLGNAHYVVAPGAKTVVMNTEHRGAHPDDWGWSQDLMLAHILSEMKRYVAGQIAAKVV
jgi:hypothetical protein